MKIKIVIQMLDMQDYGSNQIQDRRAVVFEGELDIAPKGEYLTKISLLSEGMEHPICDVPFSPTVGYWKWIPPMMDDSQAMEIMEQIMMKAGEVVAAEQREETEEPESEGPMPA